MKIIILLLFVSSFVFAENASYQCNGMSHFELVGASGAKEEKQTRDYNFVDLVLIDLNEIPCELNKDVIQCSSNLLNVRNLTLNLKSLKIKDSISGNKGFGHYIENFDGICQKK